MKVVLLYVLRCIKSNFAAIRKKKKERWGLFWSLTLLPGLSDDVSGTLAHYLGDIQRAVGLIGHSHRAIYSLCLHLEKKQIIMHAIKQEWMMNVRLKSLSAANSLLSSFAPCDIRYKYTRNSRENAQS